MERRYKKNLSFHTFGEALMERCRVHKNVFIASKVKQGLLGAHA
jgi:hypothetical protein